MTILTALERMRLKKDDMLDVWSDCEPLGRGRAGFRRSSRDQGEGGERKLFIWTVQPSEMAWLGVVLMEMVRSARVPEQEGQSGYSQARSVRYDYGYLLRRLYDGSAGV